MANFKRRIIEAGPAPGSRLCSLVGFRVFNNKVAWSYPRLASVRTAYCHDVNILTYFSLSKEGPSHSSTRTSCFSSPGLTSWLMTYDCDASLVLSLWFQDPIQDTMLHSFIMVSIFSNADRFSVVTSLMTWFFKEFCSAWSLSMSLCDVSRLRLCIWEENSREMILIPSQYIPGGT